MERLKSAISKRYSNSRFYYWGFFDYFFSILGVFASLALSLVLWCIIEYHYFSNSYYGNAVVVDKVYSGKDSPWHVALKDGKFIETVEVLPQTYYKLEKGQTVRYEDRRGYITRFWYGMELD